MAGNRDRALKFRAELTGWNTKVYGRMDLVVRRVSMVLVQNIVVGGAYGPGTPIDTGFARASWWVSVGTDSRTTAGPAKPRGKGQRDEFGDGSEDFATAMTVLAGVRAGGGTIYILNDAAYIVPLEYGWSKQAPVGMVRIVLTGFQGIVNDAVQALG